MLDFFTNSQVSIKRRRNSPHPAFAVAELGLLFGRILVQSIRRVRDNRVDGVVFLSADPIKAIRVVENCLADTKRFPPWLRGRGLPLDSCSRPAWEHAEVSGLACKRPRRTSCLLVVHASKIDLWTSFAKERSEKKTDVQGPKAAFYAIIPTHWYIMVP